MGVLTESSTIDPEVSAYFDRRLLVRARPHLHHAKVAQRRRLPNKTAETIKFRRFEKLGLALAPLVEGAPPTGKQLSKTDVTATIKQYGDYVTLSDKVQAIIQSPILREANDVLSQQMAETLDALARDVFVAGTSVTYANSESSRSAIQNTNHLVDTTMLDQILRKLAQQNARRFTRIIEATTRVGTGPIRPAYWAITTPEVKFTLEGLSNYKSIEEYASQGPVMMGEIGAYKNLRFLESTQAKSWPGGGGTATGVAATGGNADVHAILCFGQDAVGTVPLDQLTVRNILKPLGSAGSADPLNQIGTSGWKNANAHVRLNENFMDRGECAVAS